MIPHDVVTACLSEPLRYSEDLDYVRVTASGIRPLTQALTELGDTLGFDVRTRVGEHPKVLWQTTATTGAALRINSGRTGVDPIFEGAADFDLELIEQRTLDSHIQELIYRPTLEA